MKKQLLSILTVLFTAMLANGQDVTSYRGAFAPAPEPQWTDGWTNFNPQAAVYSAPTVTVSGSITSNTTWTSNNVYLLAGLVYVNDGVTLTIQPGTVIRGDNATLNSSLIITRGAKIQAIGTACNPIVFTTSLNSGRTPGDWGGIIMLGKARHNLGTNNLIEGLPSTEPRNFHGGTNDDDNSGTLKYVRIEFGGFVFAPNNEINGLTMGSIGRGTTIDYVQTSFVNDDAFEWFGGTVNCKHLVAYRCLDDDFDTDNGFSGIIQYGLSVKDPAIADNPTVSTSEGFESDNDATGSTGTPKTSAKFYNITQIGAFRCASNTAGSGVQPSATGFRRGARFRRNTELKVFNSIFMNNWRGFIADAPTIATAQFASQNNIIAGDFTSTWVAPYAGKSLASEDAITRTYVTNPNYAIDSINTCSLLTNAWSFTNPDYRPNTGGDGAIITDINTVSTGADVTPIVEIDGGLFTPNQAVDFLVDVLENGGGGTAGSITITLPKPSGWNITVPGLVLTAANQSGTNGNSNVSGGTANSNGSWNFRDDGTNVIATSKPGVVIAKGGFVQIGFTATRKASTSTGTNQSLSINLGGAGDNTPANNGSVVAFSAN